jgi:hypothetical protein
VTKTPPYLGCHWRGWSQGRLLSPVFVSVILV